MYITTVNVLGRTWMKQFLLTQEKIKYYQSDTEDFRLRMRQANLYQKRGYKVSAQAKVEVSDSINLFLRKTTYFWFAKQNILYQHFLDFFTIDVSVKCNWPAL